ncbi:MAG: sarcosine oxidase subunit alpha, partial [Gammaproteobacteria bacterium]
MADLRAAGTEIVAVVNPRADARERAAVIARGAPLISGVVRRALGGRGLQGVEIEGADGHIHRFDCDLLAVSGGWSPTLHLTSHLGARPRWDAARSMFLPEQLPPGMSVAGAAGGELTTAAALAGGLRAVEESLRSLGITPREMTPPATGDEPDAWTPLWHTPTRRGKCFVDLQNDVTTDDLALAHREGFGAAEHAKRYTTLGMATDQGKTSALNGLATLAALTGRSIGEVGTTTYRPPYTPVAIGALAGHHRGPDFRPTRLTPSHEWARERGAVFIESGAWLRAQYFPRPGETDWLPPVIREVLAVRSAVGLCDVSTLGKIEIKGPDALEFIERL